MFEEEKIFSLVSTKEEWKICLLFFTELEQITSSLPLILFDENTLREQLILLLFTTTSDSRTSVLFMTLSNISSLQESASLSQNNIGALVEFIY
jgi:hypothetical protein